LSVSRLDATEQYKGQDHVLEALAQLRQTHPQLEFRYTIQGDGSDRPRLEALARELGLGEITRFTGSVKDRTELENLYAQSDLFVLPSRYGRWQRKWRGEGFGIVYLEAAAFGVPSLAYDCGGVKDIFTSEKDGWLAAPDDIPALAQALATLAQDRTRLAALGRAAKARTEVFTKRSVAREWAAAATQLKALRPGKVKASQSQRPFVQPQPAP
ncbi:glycosyltransferase, partial [bacterium]|nr:glycosyltransferase [bacterium]